MHCGCMPFAGVFDCKPLPVLWAKLPEYNDQNTIMLDDLRRNYAFNPQNGLVIRPYRFLPSLTFIASAWLPACPSVACRLLSGRTQMAWMRAHASGLKAHAACMAGRKAHLNRARDRELLYLKLYLLKIARLDSLASLKHRRWERYVAEEIAAVDRERPLQR